ncbi:MAG: hypothetical protein R2852_04215 [Bacteroidia bacterium]
MKILKLFAFILICSPFLFSCKKKTDKPKGDQIHVAYNQDGVQKDYRPPLYGLSWDNLAVSFQFHRSFDYNESFIFRLYKRIETGKTYTIDRNTWSQINISYEDSSENYYRLSEGEFYLSEKDSLSYLYKGTFSGLFIEENDLDSFYAKNGEFYFKKTF